MDYNRNNNYNLLKNSAFAHLNYITLDWNMCPQFLKTILMLNLLG